MPPAYSQQGRQLQIFPPPEADSLLLIGFEGTEEFNRLFRYQLTILSTSSAVAPKDIVGKNLSFSVALPNKSPRYFNGYVSRFSFVGKDDRFSRYVAEVVPWTWFMTQTRDCRIFQDKTVPEIINEIFRDFPMAKVDDAEIRGHHDKWEYCVQYRESDFDFVSRLMEQEGIYSYFKHDKDKHTLILGDAVRGYKTADEPGATFRDKSGGGATSDDILDWRRVYEFRPGKWAHADYNYLTPSATVAGSAAARVTIPTTDQFEVFDYPGDFDNRDQGDADARLRMEEISTGADVVHGRSVNASWGPGFKFTVQQHNVLDEEGNKYVVCTTQHKVVLADEYYNNGNAGDVPYSNSFTAISAAKTYRPARATPRPMVHGPQTAVVVGAPGDTIPVDATGRVKVSFFWDRRSQKNDTSSCWIRVSQTAGGGSWGGQFHPHAGHEVIVSFIEGDPDRPIITGRVYNEDNRPPMNAAANKTKSTIVDHGGNRILMEGADGAQYMHMHSPSHASSVILGNSVDLSSSSNFTGRFSGDQDMVFSGTSSTEVGSNMQIRVGYGDTAVLGNASDENSLSNADSTVNASNPPVQTGWDSNASGYTLYIGVDGDYGMNSNNWFSSQTGNFASETSGASSTFVLGLNNSIVLGGNLGVVVGLNASVVVGLNVSAVAALNVDLFLGHTISVHREGSSQFVILDQDLTSAKGDVTLEATLGKVNVISPLKEVTISSKEVVIQGATTAALAAALVAAEAAVTTATAALAAGPASVADLRAAMKAKADAEEKAKTAAAAAAIGNTVTVNATGIAVKGPGDFTADAQSISFTTKTGIKFNTTKFDALNGAFTVGP